MRSTELKPGLCEKMGPMEQVDFTTNRSEPLQNGSSRSPSPPLSNEEDGDTTRRPQRILLAEDDLDIRESLARLLEFNGYDVHAVSDGAQFLDYLAGWLFNEDTGDMSDVIITDIRMPGFNGLSIVDGLRASGWTHPVIVMSAFGDENVRSQVDKLGKAEFIAKPFLPEDLERALARLLN